MQGCRQGFQIWRARNIEAHSVGLGFDLLLCGVRDLIGLVWVELNVVFALTVEQSQFKLLRIGANGKFHSGGEGPGDQSHCFAEGS